MRTAVPPPSAHVGGGVIGEGCGRSAGGGISLERARRARKGFEGDIMVEVAGIVSGVPQHASLCSPVADIPSPISSVPIFSLDYVQGWMGGWMGGG